MKEAEAPVHLIKMIESPNADDNRQFKEMFYGASDEVFIEPVMNRMALTKTTLPTGERYGNEPPNTIRQRQFALFRCTLLMHSDLRVSVCCVDGTSRPSSATCAMRP